MTSCPVCTFPLDPALTTAGLDAHPNCAPDQALSAEQLRAVVSLLADALGARLIDKSGP